MFRKILFVMLTAAGGLFAAEFASPVLVTSGGQSADVQMVKTLLTREGIDFELKPMAASADLENVRSMIVVLGGSSKGLGAAKVSAEEESARMNELIQAAQKRSLPILAVHVGGKNRRGALSDEFNGIGAAGASELIVVSGGDDDQFFQKIAEEKKIPYVQAAKISDLGPMLKSKFAVSETSKE